MSSLEYEASAHSRNSSSTSENYSPLTPTFSLREHSRVASASSSLATTPPTYEYPDSPFAPAKTMLHDLVEDPGEREDDFDLCSDGEEARNSFYQNECLQVFSTPPRQMRRSLDYDLADGICSESDTSLPRTRKRSASGDSAASPLASFASRIGHRLPSLSRRLKEKTPTIAVSPQAIRSAPPSRAPSFRMSSLTKSLSTHLESREMFTPPQSPVDFIQEDALTSPSRTSALAIEIPVGEDPIDRQALASTPLLPPTALDRRGSDDDSIQSPLQSPAVVARGTFSSSESPLHTPFPSTMSTPALSTKPSMASFVAARSTQLLPTSEIPAIGINDADDKWAARLGHANFSIFPEPYTPKIATAQSCKRLTEDWEAARRQYMSHAAHTNEHYGLTSQTYKFTEQKWAEIDGRWKRFHERTISQAAANGEALHALAPPLAEPAPLMKMPSIDGPESRGKFPTLEESEIVGPMVQYASKIQPRPAKKSILLKMFNDLRITTPKS